MAPARHNAHPDYQLLENVIATSLHLQLCSTHYTALKTKNSAISASAINPVTMEIVIVRVPQLSITGK